MISNDFSPIFMPEKIKIAKIKKNENQWKMLLNVLYIKNPSFNSFLEMFVEQRKQQLADAK